jgi:DNA-binding response OmpR family regulator
MSLNPFKKKKTVLLVEDDSVLRTALKDEFEQKGWFVVEASGADGVPKVLQENKLDVVVLDLILPSKDGVSLLEEMRASGHTFAVIILSNLAGSDNLRHDAERLDAVFLNKSSVMLSDVVKTAEEKVNF